jgi:hypothetical protein
MVHKSFDDLVWVVKNSAAIVDDSEGSWVNRGRQGPGGRAEGELEFAPVIQVNPP